MSSVVEEFIEHHGKKGMKWGVRKANRQAYKGWKKQASSAETGASVINATAKSFNPALKKINNSPKFKGKNLNTDKKLSREYNAVVQAGFNQHMAMNSIKQTGTSLKGGRAVVWQMKGPYLRPIEVKVVRHSSTDAQTIIPEGVTVPSFKLIKDADGFVIGFEPAPVEIKQSIDGEEFIEHYGKKGMRWGIRKAPKPDRRPSSDFKKTAPLRGKNVSTLTNKQLKSLNERMNLEQNYKRLNPSKAQQGKAAAAGILATAGMAASAYQLFKSPAGQAAVNAGKKFMNRP